MGERACRPSRGPSRAGAELEPLILDTSVLIEAERLGDGLDRFLDDDDDAVMAAVTAAELLTGVARADARRGPARAKAVEAMLEAIPIVDYDLRIARSHALLLAHAQKAGSRRGSHDLIVAATAVATGRTVVTMDPRGFSGLPGVLFRAE